MNSEDAIATDGQAIEKEVAPLSDSILVTRQGKIRHWVKHGLDFFEVCSMALPSTVHNALPE
jgi:hypothetical protein